MENQNTGIGNSTPEIRERKQFWLKFPFSLIVIALYLVLGYFFNLWKPAWPILLTIFFYRTVVNRMNL